MQARHPLARSVVELAANGHAILDELRHEIAGVIGVKPVGSKVARAASVQAIVESGAIVLPAHAPWLEDWIDEGHAFTAEGSGALVTTTASTLMVWALRELSRTCSRYDVDVPGAAASGGLANTGARSAEVLGGYGGSIERDRNDYSVVLGGVRR